MGKKITFRSEAQEKVSAVPLRLQTRCGLRSAQNQNVC
jgi:hypothetical protein